jgi:hypothetical protein
VARESPHNGRTTPDPRTSRPSAKQLPMGLCLRSKDDDTLGLETNVEGWGIDLHIDKRYLVGRGVALGWKRWSARGWSRGDEVQLIERRGEISGR